MRYNAMPLRIDCGLPRCGLFAAGFSSGGPCASNRLPVTISTSGDHSIVRVIEPPCVCKVLDTLHSFPTRHLTYPPLDLPTPPDLPAPPDLPDLPDLLDLRDLPDLPDLSDLRDLPDGEHPDGAALGHVRELARRQPVQTRLHSSCVD